MVNNMVYYIQRLRNGGIEHEVQQTQNYEAGARTAQGQQPAHYYERRPPRLLEAGQMERLQGGTQDEG